FAWLPRRKNFQKCFCFCHERVRKITATALVAAVFRNRRIQHHVENHSYRFHAPVSSPSRGQFGKPPIHTQDFGNAGRHTSKDDRRKRQRHDEVRSEPIERIPFRRGDASDSAFRGCGRFLFLHSCL